MIARINCFNMGSFPGTVMFVNGFEYDDLMAELKKKKNAKEWYFGLQDDKALIDKGNYFALKREIRKSDEDFDRQLFYIIIKEEFTFTDYQYAKLAHEILHICQFFLPDILDRNREFEAEAYLHTHLMMQCLKALRA